MQAKRPIRYGFFLVPNFTLLAFSSAVDALRMANLSSGETLYEWLILTPGDEPVASSAGLSFSSSLPLEQAHTLDKLFVCAGVHVEASWNSALGDSLRRLSGMVPHFGALCTASYLLAKAGVLKEHRCTVHWEYISSLREEFPLLKVTDELFEIDRSRYTCAGGTAPLDLMMHLIGQDYSRDISMSISEQFVVERIRGLGEPQSAPVRNYAPGAPNYFAEAVSLMKANISEPLFVREIAECLGISTRQLERVFFHYFRCPPSQYYLKLRLNAARNLLRHSSVTAREIAIETGFKSLQHFSKCYYEYFRLRPSQERGPGAPSKPPDRLPLAS